MTASPLAATMAERRADRLSREQRTPKDPLAGTVCSVTEERIGDSRRQRYRRVRVYSWHRKDSQTLVAQQIGDAGHIAFVAPSMPTPLSFGPDTEPMLRFTAGRGPVAPLNVTAVVDSGRTKKYGPPRPIDKAAASDPNDDLRAQVDWLMQQVADRPIEQPPVVESRVELPVRGRRRRRTGQ